ncbi:hypothetical protein HK104_004219 [Borealophlyctis nickersoniae]|nr:hypothetical protein HK104_004219 [Borealophlyctis nickersoniae]
MAKYAESYLVRDIQGLANLSFPKDRDVDSSKKDKPHLKNVEYGEVDAARRRRSRSIATAMIQWKAPEYLKRRVEDIETHYLPELRNPETFVEKALRPAKKVLKEWQEKTARDYKSGK